MASWQPQGGTVYFVGAGPGDPDLITLRGQKVLAAADLVLYTDSLVHPDICQWCKPGCRIEGSAGLHLDQIVDRMLATARAGGVVARVHTGDPSLFGAVLEQVVALEKAGVPYEVVPGVTSAVAGAAVLKSELTVPELAQTVIFTRMAGRTPVPPRERLRDLAAHQCSLVLFLSVTLIEAVVAECLAGGYAPDTPVAVVQRATWPDQKVVRGTLETIARQVREAGIRSHSLIYVGKCFDPRLNREGEQYRSRLYDRDFSHGYRKGDTPLQRSLAAQKRGEG